MKNMKKAYIVPTVQFEEFELTTKIAGSCGDDWIAMAKEQWNAFNSATEGCEGDYGEMMGPEYDGTCYHTITVIVNS